MNRVDRLMGYMLLFQSRGLMRAQDFAAQFEISERTVYRDVQALSEVGVPIVAMPGEGYRLMEGYYLPPITFRPDEARALYLAMSMLVGLTQPGQTRESAKTALEKVRAVLPTATLRQVEALEAIMRFYAMPNTALDFDDEIFLVLQEAIHDQQVVHLHYHAQNSNSVTQRDVEPVELIFLDKTWLLRAYCRLREAPRFFRLERIDDLRVKKETFTPRDLGPLTERQSTSHVIIRFDNEIVRWVRERQHFSLVEEKTTQSPNESVIMVYQPRTFEQITGWLLGWGDKMEIVEPPELRQQVAAIAAEILAKHQP